MEGMGPSLNETLSRNLRMIYSLRQRREKNLEEFAGELGISHTTLQNILRRRSNPRLDTVEAIARGLKTSPQQLLSARYPEPDLTVSVVALETLDWFVALSPWKKEKIIPLIIQIMRTLAEQE